VATKTADGKGSANI